jgi:hypothetical protein
MPAGGHETGWHPSPSSPPVPAQLEYPAKELTENGDASVQTLSMLSFGRLMVTLQPVGPFSDVVPPGHSAESNTPPELLFTVNVKSWLGHLQSPPVQKLV